MASATSPTQSQSPHSPSKPINSGSFLVSRDPLGRRTQRRSSDSHIPSATRTIHSSRGPHVSRGTFVVGLEPSKSLGARSGTRESLTDKRTELSDGDLEARADLVDEEPEDVCIIVGGTEYSLGAYEAQFKAAKGEMNAWVVDQLANETAPIYVGKNERNIKYNFGTGECIITWKSDDGTQAFREVRYYRGNKIPGLKELKQIYSKFTGFQAGEFQEGALGASNGKPTLVKKEASSPIGENELLFRRFRISGAKPNESLSKIIAGYPVDKQKEILSRLDKVEVMHAVVRKSIRDRKKALKAMPVPTDLNAKRKYDQELEELDKAEERLQNLDVEAVFKAIVNPASTRDEINAHAKKLKDELIAEKRAQLWVGRFRKVELSKEEEQYCEDVAMLNANLGMCPDYFATHADSFERLLLINFTEPSFNSALAQLIPSGDFRKIVADNFKAYCKGKDILNLLKTVGASHGVFAATQATLYSEWMNERNLLLRDHLPELFE